VIFRFILEITLFLDGNVAKIFYFRGNYYTEQHKESSKQHKAYENYTKAQLLKNKVKKLCFYVVKKN